MRLGIASQMTLLPGPWNNGSFNVCSLCLSTNLEMILVPLLRNFDYFSSIKGSPMGLAFQTTAGVARSLT